jgi:hypothetical protein
MGLLALLALIGLAGCGQASPSPANSGFAGRSTPADARATLSPDKVPPSFAPTPSAAPSISAAGLRMKSRRGPMRLPIPVSRAAVLDFGSTVLLCGGLTSSGATTGSIFRIVPATGSVSRVGSLQAPVHDAGGAVLGGVGYMVGGGRFGPGAAVQKLGPSGVNDLVGELPTIRADLVAVTVGDRLIVVGGGTPAQPDRSVLATTDGIHFALIAELRVGVRYPAVATVGGLIYVIGGSTPGGDSNLIQVVDPSSGTVRTVGHLAHPLSHASALVVGGRLLIAGGRSGGRAENAVWQLDPATGQVQAIGRLPYSISDAAAVVADGIGYLVGGEAAGPVATTILIEFAQ